MQGPSLVTVLRAGHGAPGGQSSTSSSTDTSGQPECKGEKLDNLIRIGLLQLISGTEGLQMQSTPESLQVNLLRLRALQGQFQQVIVISIRYVTTFILGLYDLVCQERIHSRVKLNY